MNKEEFLKTLYLKYEDLLKDYRFQKLVLKDLIEIGLVYVREHFNNSENKSPNMMLQMSLMKAKSVLKLSEGEVFQNNRKSDEPFIDIQSISSVYRSLFENYCFFNHLYTQAWTDEEFLVLENLWRISSLLQRMNLLNRSLLLKRKDNIKKIKRDKNDVVRMTNEIKQTFLYKKNEKFIDNCLKRYKWQLTIDKETVKSISWKELFKNTRKNHANSDKVYQRFSLDAHPSYFSVFQFGDLYKDRHDLKRITSVMFETIQLLCCYLYDFEKLLKKIPETNIESKYLIEILGKNTN